MTVFRDRTILAVFPPHSYSALPVFTRQGFFSALPCPGPGRHSILTSCSRRPRNVHATEARHAHAIRACDISKDTEEFLMSSYQDPLTCSGRAILHELYFLGSVCDTDALYLTTINDPSSTPY
jgi:hypothetical protein